MPLTLRSNGTTTASLVTAAWWNDYYNLLTGGMVDQSLYIKATTTLQEVGAAPNAAPYATPVAAATGVDAGSHVWAVAFGNANGTTLPSPTVTAVVTAGNQQVNISLPLGITGCDRRVIYRSKAGATQLYLVATVNDNTSTGYADVTPDSSLVFVVPVFPTFGGTLQVFDASGAFQACIAADGQLRCNGTATLANVKTSLVTSANVTNSGSITTTGLFTQSISNSGTVTTNNVTSTSITNSGNISTDGIIANNVYGNPTFTGNVIINGTLTNAATTNAIAAVNTTATAAQVTAAAALPAAGGTISGNVTVSGSITTGSIAAPGSSALIMQGSAFGFKTQAGVKLAEFKNNGDFVISGANMKTTNASFAYGTGGAFDAFDVAEVYIADKPYAVGSVLCPSGESLSVCTHDACHAAVVVSTGGGFSIGNIDAYNGSEALVYIALAGRVLVQCTQMLAPRTRVTSDGNGGVRAATNDERSIGFALTATKDKKVGIFLRCN